MTGFDDLFQKAERLEREGELYAALECWRDLASRQSDPAVWCRLAHAAMELDLADEAERAFRSALEEDPSLATAYAGLGTLSMERKDSESAERLFRKALAYEQDASTYCLLGSTQLDQGRLEAAQQSFLTALELDPTSDEAYYNLGVIYRDSDPVESERLILKAIQLDADFAAAHRELGFLRLRAHDLDVAEYHLRRARQLDPENMWGRVYLANLCWQKGNLQEARQEYVGAILLAQDVGYPRYWFANFLETQGELDEAEKHYREALALQNDDVDTLARLAGLLNKKGAHSLAIEFLERALRIEPHNKAALKVQKALDSTP